MTEEQQYSFYVMPWLRLPAQRTFGSVTVARLSTVLAKDDPRSDTVARILSTYRGPAPGRPDVAGAGAR